MDLETAVPRQKYTKGVNDEKIIGSTVTLPTPGGIIAILIGLFDTPGATIQALNASGGVEDVQQVPADHLLHQITLTQTANPIV